MDSQKGTSPHSFECGHLSHAVSVVHPRRLDLSLCGKADLACMVEVFFLEWVLILSSAKTIKITLKELVSVMVAAGHMYFTTWLWNHRQILWDYGIRTAKVIQSYIFSGIWFTSVPTIQVSKDSPLKTDSES